MCFGQDRSCRYRQKFTIAFYYTLMLHSAVGFEAVTINEQKRWYNRQLVNGAMHSLERGVQNVNNINLFFVVDFSNSPGKSVAFNIFAQVFAFRAG